MPLVNLFIGLLALLGFALSLLAHCLTFADVDVQSAVPYVWLLHIGYFIVFIPLVVSLHRDFGAKPSFSELRSVFPKWAAFLLTCTFIYALVNFALFFHLSEGGGPSEQGGMFVLQSHGKLIRQLSEAEYHTQRAYVVRGFSGHWLVFYLVPTLYFLFRSPQSREASAGGA